MKKLVENLLDCLLPPRQLEVSIGDLLEKYERRISQGTPRWQANLLYIMEGIGFIRMASRSTQRPANSIDMLSNYMKIAWRTLVKERGYTLINLASLSIAIAFLSLVTLYLRHELSFDGFHTEADKLFRLSRTSYDGDGSVNQNDPYLPAPLGPGIAADYPQIKAFTRVMEDTYLIRVGSELYQEDGSFVDPAFFSMFSFPLQRGTALAEGKVHDVVISKSLAAKLFPTGTDPLGKVIEVNIEGVYQPMTISGVAENFPANSTLRHELVMNLGLYLQTERGRNVADRWTSSFLQTYILVNKPTDAAELRSHMIEFRRKHYPDEVKELMARQLWTDSTKVPVSYHLMNVTDMHNASDFPNSIDSKKYFNLGGIALIVLLLACFNFMLLSLGKARRRSLEIGMRKTLGANRGQVVVQFWSESILTALAGMTIGVVLIYISLPLFNEVVQTTLRFEDIFQPDNLAFLAGISLLTGILAGFYPSLVLSSQPPVRVMAERTGKRSSIFSESLVSVQFGLSVFFILMALIVAQQLHHVKTMNLGIPTEGILRLSARGSDPVRLQSFREKLETFSFVKETSALRASLPIYTNNSWSHEGATHKAYLLEADRRFTKMFGITILEGQDFSPNDADTTNVILVNESLVRSFPGADLVGHPLPGYPGDSQVIGIFKDFHFQSLESKIEPMVISINPMLRGRPRPRQTLLVKMELSNSADNIATIEKEWKAAFPDLPFNHAFLRDDLHEEYVSHERWSMLMVSASGMAVFIACLGLIGFSTLHVNNRLKEIGVRKVMGGTSVGIFRMVSFRFFKLIALGGLLAVPLAWYQSTEWLAAFAYRIEPGWGTFAIGLTIALVLGLLVVSYLLVRIARLNPVTILRAE